MPWLRLRPRLSPGEGIRRLVPVFRQSVRVPGHALSKPGNQDLRVGSHIHPRIVWNVGRVSCAHRGEGVSTTYSISRLPASRERLLDSHELPAWCPPIDPSRQCPCDASRRPDCGMLAAMTASRALNAVSSATQVSENRVYLANHDARAGITLLKP